MCLFYFTLKAERRDYMYGFNTNFYQPTSQNLIRVNGIEGARAYQMSANSQAALFDSNNDIMFIKTTDGAGFPVIRTFKFEEVTENAPSNFVTRKELEEYVKQFISEPNTNADGEPNAIRTEVIGG